MNVELEGHVDEPKATLLPVYFIADESNSMSELVGELNRGLNSLLDELQGEEMAAAKVRFAVIGFADDAVCYLPPSDLRRVPGMPTLQVRGGTSFSAAFDELRNRIPSDIHALKDQGYLVNRPAVFFLTDGEPNPGDGWEAALSQLQGIQQHPNILAFGIGQADADVIRKVASKPEYAFAAAEGANIGKAISSFMQALTQSVVNSGHSMASGQGSLQVEPPTEFKPLAIPNEPV
jgi:uncharacterized protein YegL